MPAKIDEKYLETNRRMDEVIAGMAPGETLTYTEIERLTGYHRTSVQAAEQRALLKLRNSNLKHWIDN